MGNINRKILKAFDNKPSIGRHFQTSSGMKALDFSIYKNPQLDCFQSPDDIPITERCCALKRLCTASLYFDAMNSSKLEDAAKKTLWVEFNEEIYRSVVEDIIHLVQNHDDDIQQIQREWTERYGIPKCIVSECRKTARHYGRERSDRDIERNKLGEDALYAFHQTLHDQVHHFLFHLYDIGMRVEAPSIAHYAEDDEEKVGNVEGVTVDKRFAAERDHIKSRKKKLNMISDRRNAVNNKYTLQTLLQNEGGVTLLDALFQKLSDNTNVPKDAVHRIREYFEENSFDSECIEMDIEELVESNIFFFVENQDSFETMAEFIRSINRMIAFSLSS